MVDQNSGSKCESFGKTSSHDHNWPDNIDHQKPELSTCSLAMYVNCNVTGELWSISPAFATLQVKQIFKFTVLS